MCGRVLRTQNTLVSNSANEITLAFVAAINPGDAAGLRQYMTEDHTFTDARGNSFSGADKMVSAWQHFFHAYPDYRIRIKHMFAEGDKVALFGEAEGGWRINEIVLSQRWRVSAAWLAEIEVGKIRRWSVFCDTNWATPPK